MRRSSVRSLIQSGATGCNPAFHLSSHTGMRRGEILGLRWCDLHLDVGRLSVRQALVLIAYEVQISDVKTGTGRRTIDLDPGTVDVMKAWRIESGGVPWRRPGGPCRNRTGSCCAAGGSHRSARWRGARWPRWRQGAL